MNSSISRFFTIFILAIAFTSCKNGENNDAKDNSIDSLNSNQVANSKDFNQIGFDLMKTEKIGELKIGLKIGKVIELLGMPEKKSKHELWGADDSYHQEWNYISKGISLDVIGKTENEQEVNSISVSKPCTLKTNKQIAIGNTMQEVQNAYSESIDTTWSDNGNIVAGSVYGGLIFAFEKDILISIFIGASAE